MGPVPAVTMPAPAALGGAAVWRATPFRSGTSAWQPSRRGEVMTYGRRMVAGGPPLVTVIVRLVEGAGGISGPSSAPGTPFFTSRIDRLIAPLSRHFCVILSILLDSMRIPSRTDAPTVGAACSASQASRNTTCRSWASRVRRSTVLRGRAGTPSSTTSA